MVENLNYWNWMERLHVSPFCVESRWSRNQWRSINWLIFFASIEPPSRMTFNETWRRISNYWLYLHGTQQKLCENGTQTKTFKGVGRSENIGKRGWEPLWNQSIKRNWPVLMNIVLCPCIQWMLFVSGYSLSPALYWLNLINFLRVHLALSSSMPNGQCFCSINVPI